MGWQGEWFGIDDQGHVAMFLFNDAGVAPRVFLEWNAARSPFLSPEKRPAFEGAEPVTSLDDLDDELPGPSVFRFFTEVRQASFFPVFGAGKHAKASKKEIVVWVDDRKPVADDLRAKRARLLAKADVGILVSYSEYPTAVRNKLHGPKGACRGCLEVMWFEEYLIAGRGVFVYENEYAEWNGPYVCRAAPDKPLQANGLPTKLRKRLARTKLAGTTFASSARIQPALHLPCDSTNGRESYFIDFDGRTVRAIPGREDNFHPASFAGEGPTGEPLISPASAKKNIDFSKYRLGAVFEREAQFRELAGTMLKSRVAPWTGLTDPLPFVLVETLAQNRSRCFFGDLRDVPRAKRAIVDTSKVEAWLDRHAKGWRDWHEERGPSTPKSNDDLFRRLVSDVLPGSADPFGSA